MPKAEELADRVLAAHHIREVDGKSSRNDYMIDAIFTRSVGIVCLESKDHPPTIEAGGGIDRIQYCLNTAPVPCLAAAFQLFESIWDVIQLAESFKFQLRELGKTTANLLYTLNDRYQHEEPSETSILDSLSNLRWCSHLILSKLPHRLQPSTAVAC